MNMQRSQSLARWVVGYGVFLIVIGLLGFLSNPEKAKTALISGGSFGALSILWGVLGMRGVRWSMTAATVTTSLLALVFAWRASVGWLAVSAGKSEKLVAAILITAMLAASAALLPFLLKGRKAAAAEKPGDTQS